MTQVVVLFCSCRLTKLLQGGQPNTAVTAEPNNAAPVVIFKRRTVFANQICSPYSIQQAKLCIYPSIQFPNLFQKVQFYSFKCI